MKITNIYLSDSAYREVANAIIYQGEDQRRFGPRALGQVDIDMDNIIIHRYAGRPVDPIANGAADDLVEGMKGAFARSGTKQSISETQIGGSHYTKYAIQPFEYTYKNKLSWPQGECIKYVTRFEDKGGEQDLDKAIHILQMLKAARYGGKG